MARRKAEVVEQVVARMAETADGEDVRLPKQDLLDVIVLSMDGIRSMTDRAAIDAIAAAVASLARLMR